MSSRFVHQIMQLHQHLQHIDPAVRRKRLRNGREEARGDAVLFMVVRGIGAAAAEEVFSPLQVLSTREGQILFQDTFIQHEFHDRSKVFRIRSTYLERQRMIIVCHIRRRLPRRLSRHINLLFHLNTAETRRSPRIRGVDRFKKAARVWLETTGRFGLVVPEPWGWRWT